MIQMCILVYGGLKYISRHGIYFNVLEMVITFISLLLKIVN